MWSLISTVLIASLFGSLHCVGMCGPLAMLASSHSARRQNQPSANLAAVTAYHGSRVLAYSLAGATVGLIGAGIQSTGSLLGLQRLAAHLAGGSMLVIGLLSITRLASGTAHSVWLPAWLQRQLGRGHQWARQQSPIVRAAVIGVLTAVLPCGWLMAFLIVAAGTASAVHGALVMAVFALGSAPALAGWAFSMSLLIGRYRPLIPWSSAVLVAIVGAVTLLDRASLDLAPMATGSQAQTSAVLTQQVTRLEHQKLPCCIAREEALKQKETNPQ